jgi:hypothetical protein
MHEQVREAPNFGEKCHRVFAVLRLARLFFLRALAFFIRVLPGKNGASVRECLCQRGFGLEEQEG